jgi:hypothetical protein
MRASANESELLEVARFAIAPLIKGWLGSEPRFGGKMGLPWRAAGKVGFIPRKFPPRK